MAKTHLTWTVLEHGPLERLADNLWRVKGSLSGMSLKRVMTVVRRDDGSLLLHSPIALDDHRQRELEALGSIAVLVVPNAGHRLDAPAYKRRYPHALVFCPANGRRKSRRWCRSTAATTTTPTTASCASRCSTDWTGAKAR